MPCPDHGRPRPRRQCRAPEPAWHVRARRQRAADRTLLRVTAAALRLARHHGSAVPRILSGIAQGADLRACAPPWVPPAATPTPGASVAEDATAANDADGPAPARNVESPEQDPEGMLEDAVLAAASPVARGTPSLPARYAATADDAEPVPVVAPLAAPLPARNVEGQESVPVPVPMVATVPVVAPSATLRADAPVFVPVPPAAPVALPPPAPQQGDNVLARILIKAIVRVLRFRADGNLGPLPIDRLEAEYGARMNVPFSLRDTGETDVVTCLKKWPDQVEITTTDTGQLALRLVASHVPPWSDNPGLRSDGASQGTRPASSGAVATAAAPPSLSSDVLADASSSVGPEPVVVPATAVVPSAAADTDQRRCREMAVEALIARIVRGDRG